ncbi:MAG: hypothetical protein ACI4L5_02605 [Negativibacillus sp.]
MTLSKETRKRIAAFLAQYVEATSGSIFLESDEEFIDGIELLIESEIFTKDQLKKECLKDYSVVIPDYLFGKFSIKSKRG